MAEKLKVLFLCTGNSCRSQMAEAFLRKYGGDRFEAFSAGLSPKEIHPLARQVMAEAGLDLSGQRSKSVREYMGKVHFAWLVTVCDKAQKSCPTTFPGVGARLFWPFEDPAEATGSDEEKLAKFREIRDGIDQRVQAWLREVDSEPAQPSRRGDRR